MWELRIKRENLLVKIKDQNKEKLKEKLNSAMVIDKNAKWMRKKRDNWRALKRRFLLLGENVSEVTNAVISLIPERNLTQEKSFISQPVNNIADCPFASIDLSDSLEHKTNVLNVTTVLNDSIVHGVEVNDHLEFKKIKHTRPPPTTPKKSFNSISQNNFDLDLDPPKVDPATNEKTQPDSSDSSFQVRENPLRGIPCKGEKHGSVMRSTELKNIDHSGILSGINASERKQKVSEMIKTNNKNKNNKTSENNNKITTKQQMKQTTMVLTEEITETKMLPTDYSKLGARPKTKLVKKNVSLSLPEKIFVARNESLEKKTENLLNLQRNEECVNENANTGKIILSYMTNDKDSCPNHKVTCDKTNDMVNDDKNGCVEHESVVKRMSSE